MERLVNIRTLKETDLKKYSFAKTLEVIEALEKIVIEESSKVFISQTDDITDLEVFEDYYSKVVLVRNRIKLEEFQDKPKKGWPSQKENLLSRLLNIMITFQRIRDSIILSFEVLHTEEEISRLKKLQEDLFADYNEKKLEIEDTVKKNLQEVDDKLKIMQQAENKTVSHVLSLMGIFTAVITIILSVVVTSSSWLNNASGASAILAFVIPNMVTLIAVISIILLVFMYQKIFYPTVLSVGEKEKKAPIILSVILLIIILFIAIFMSVLAYRTTRIEPHLRHVIGKTEYVVNERKDSNTEEVCKYIEFVFEGQSYEFIYDESYFHDSNLYYCPVHNTLE